MKQQTYTRYVIGYSYGPSWIYTATAYSLEEAKAHLETLLYCDVDLEDRHKVTEELKRLTYVEQVSEGLVGL